MVESRSLQAARWLVLAVSAVVLLFPVYWMLASSLTPSARLMSTQPSLIPTAPTLNHYRHVLADSPFPTFVGNSAKIATIVTMLTLPIALLGGYALSRFRFRGRTTFGVVLLCTQMLPAIMLAIPLYVTMARLGLIDTHTALVVCYTTFTLPFAIWMLRGFFEGLPAEIEESARVDGCSLGGLLWRVVLPLSAPGLAVTAILAFLMAWNEYLFAMLLINSQGKMRAVLTRHGGGFR